MNTTQIVAEILFRENIDFITCIPSTPLIEASAAVGIRPIVCRQERTGVHIADGYSRINNGRRVGVFAMQAGPGAENAFGGVAQAYADSTPILLIPTGVPLARRSIPPSFNSVRCFGPITKWTGYIENGDQIEELMRQAFMQLRCGRHGPVLLEIPVDIAVKDLDVSSIAYDPPPESRTPGEPEAVRRVVKALLAANHPILCAGQGVLYAEATKELVELAETLNAPVMTTLLGKSCFPENHPLSLGAGASSSPDCVYHFLARADLICGVGCSFLKSAFKARIPSDRVLVHITNDCSDINKDYPRSYPLIGDAKLVLRQLLDGIRLQSDVNNPPLTRNIAAEIVAVRDRWLRNWLPRLTSDEVPINPYRVIWDVKNFFNPTDTIVTHDSGSSREQVVPFWQAIEPRSFIGWGNSTQLGFSLGLALGAKLAAPRKHVINFMGDAAFGMVGLDIETAVRARIPIITILFNNSTMGIYSDNDFPVAGKRYAVKTLSGNYARVAQALGAHAERIFALNELIPALERAIEATEKDRPALLEVITKEERNFSNCTVFDPL